MTTTATITSSLQKYIDQYREKWPFSGTVLVAREGRIVHLGAYGSASLEHRVPNRRNTRFGIWSISKSFAAMAIMLLARQNRLQLDALASQYIPEMKTFGAITVRHLLNHRSGLPNMTSLPQYNGNYNKWPMGKEAFFELLAKHLPHGVPGERFSYNNSGYYLLGLIVEAVSGKSYDQFLQEFILHPLGMKDTGLLTGRTIVQDLASAYHASGNTPIPAEYVEISSVGAAGGMYSTVEDLLKWDQSFYGDSLLPKGVIDDMLHDESAPYGMGWFLDRRNGHRRMYHGGAYHGFRTELHRYPEEKLTIIVLSNYNFTPVTALADCLADVALGLDARIPEFPPACSLPSGHFQRLAGTYEGYGCKAVVGENENGYYFIWNNKELNPIYPVTDTEFHHCHFLWTHHFKQDDNGSWSFLGMSKIEGEQL
ncbi:serine hydrolase domain-containing protein [Paenibacillus sp. CAU 1782]